MKNTPFPAPLPSLPSRWPNTVPLHRTAGCDALAVHLILMNVACSLNLPIGWRMMTGCYCVMVPWILAHWEEYHTGVCLCLCVCVPVCVPVLEFVFVPVYVWVCACDLLPLSPKYAAICATVAPYGTAASSRLLCADVCLPCLAWRLCAPVQALWCTAMATWV